MKILFLTTPTADYLQDSLLIGLRNVLKENVIDYPKKDILYKSCEMQSSEMYGLGFTLYKQLEDLDINIKRDLSSLTSYDLVVFGSIWRQKALYFKLLPKLVLSKARMVFIDGEDFNKIFYWSLPFGKYFKRERRRSFISLLTKPISFSIPQIKISTSQPNKIKHFATHNQCEESYKLAEVKKSCRPSYAFDEESEYYNDIALSKFAFTKKKGGWDCLRHYEIAANGTVPLFYRFTDKPHMCAPHGMVDMHNIVTFNSAEELSSKLEQIEREDLYPILRENALKWVSNNSSEEVALNFLRMFKI